MALVRDAAAGGGLEVFLQHRVATMRFAAGMTVFPGGGVEVRDRAGDRPWSGPPPQWWAERFGVGAARAAAAVRAVVRELFEETGVLLADPVGPGAPGSPASPGPPAGPERRALAAGRGDIDSVLASHDMVLAAHRLRPWDRWTTPVGPPRRYDTLFFVAALPHGGSPDAGTSEVRSAGWLRVGEAVTAGVLGRLPMMRPTLATLAELAAISDVAELLDRRRRVAGRGH